MTDTPPDPEQIYQQLSQLAAWLCPGLESGSRIRLVIESPSENGWERIAQVVRTVAVRADEKTKPLSEKAVQAIEWLSSQPRGITIKRRTLAAELELEHTGGQFRKIMAELTTAKLIETHSGPSGGITVLPEVYGDA